MSIRTLVRAAREDSDTYTPTTRHIFFHHLCTLYKGDPTGSDDGTATLNRDPTHKIIDGFGPADARWRGRFKRAAARLLAQRGARAIARAALYSIASGL